VQAWGNVLDSRAPAAGLCNRLGAIRQPYRFCRVWGIGCAANGASMQQGGGRLNLQQQCVGVCVCVYASVHICALKHVQT
jgi:hypothetical protein